MNLTSMCYRNFIINLLINIKISWSFRWRARAAHEIKFKVNLCHIKTSTLLGLPIATSSTHASSRFGIAINNPVPHTLRTQIQDWSVPSIGEIPLGLPVHTSVNSHTTVPPNAEAQDGNANQHSCHLLQDHCLAPSIWFSVLLTLLTTVVSFATSINSILDNFLPFAHQPSRAWHPP